MDKEFPIKGRYIVAIWLVPMFYLPGLNYAYGMMGEDQGWYKIIYLFYYQIFVAALLLFLVSFYKINWLTTIAIPHSREYPYAIKLTAFIFIFSIAAAYALFYPLSFIFPGFVNFWFIETIPIIYSFEGEFPLTPNLLSFLSLVILAPIMEEFTFRGILLHRWTGKWGIHCAILCSSILFGIGHPDPIGAVAFGIAMSVLYLKTKTLLVPMVCHALNNFVVWLIAVGYITFKGPDYVYTLEIFQSEWPIGLACCLISFFWARAYRQREKIELEWSLPKL